MSWYRAGTAQVTTGSAAVLGTGTLWVTKVKIGEGFLGPDNVLYEIENVSSDQSLTLTRPYAGASDPAATYAIVPTQGYLRTLATQVADLIALYSAVPGNVEDAEAAAVNAAASAATATLQANASQTSANFSEYARTQAEAAQAAASASEEAAAASAATAATKASEAATSATGALASQGAAGGSATAAANSATTASNKAGEASASASNAAGSATAANTKADEAAASASDALASKSAAASSAAAADASADVAAISEINAAASEDAAAASATAASTSASEALAYRNQTQAIADTIEEGAVLSVAGRTGDVVLTKADVGLSNVSNLAPADLPVSAATQTALNAKAPLASPGLTGTPTAPTPSITTSSTQIATTAFVHNLAATGPRTSVYLSVSVPSGALGDANASGYFRKVGRAVTYDITVNIISNGTASGAIRVLLPWLSATNSTAHGRENAVAGYALQAIVGANSDILSVFKYDGTYPGTNGAVFHLTGTYEATT